MKILKEIGSWLIYIVAAFVIASLLNVFVFQITRVQGSSMVPTLAHGDLYVISKIGNLTNSCPDYEDIIVIDSRSERVRTLGDDFTDILKYNVITSLFSKSTDDIYWVKRVIGLPGDKIKLDDGKVYRNGILLKETYVNPAEEPMYATKEIEIPEGYIWVMGDNRNHSTDSRVIGPVPVENVIGKLKFRLKSGK
ncbi:MAG: signal peptidase I [Clostridia bacterium]|nr:signal peptidase I [Clostridia bacterium]